MANTTNFGWETPDDTDLVKDGAAAIRTLGSAIDTSLMDLEGGTTGQILAKNSNTDMDFIWVAQDDSNAIQNAIVDAKGDIVAASANDTPARLAVGTNNHRLVAASGETTGLKYVADTQNTVIDAAGDLVYGTAADTLGRLAIGTAGQILQVNSGATAPEWATPSGAGGMTVLASGTFTNTATLDLTTISGSYKNLQFVARNINPNGDRTLRARFNGLTTSIYNAITITNINGAAATAAYTAEDKFVLTATTGQSPLTGPLIIDIYDYANTTSFKTITAQFNHLNNGGQVSQMWLSGTIRTNNAIDQLTLSLSAGDFVASGTYTLYGVN